MVANLLGMSDEIFGALIGFGGAVLVWLLAEAIKWIDRYWNQPTVDVRFELEGDCIVPDLISRMGDDCYRSTYVRVRITNSSNVGINNCQAWLVGVRRFENPGYGRSEFRESIPLIWSYLPELETMHIPPGVAVHADVIRFHSTTTPVPQLRHPSGGLHKLKLYEGLFAEQGRFRFEIIVSGDGMTPVASEVEYSYSADKTLVFKGTSSLELQKPTLDEWYRENPGALDQEIADQAELAEIRAREAAKRMPKPKE